MTVSSSTLPRLKSRHPAPGTAPQVGATRAQGGKGNSRRPETLGNEAGYSLVSGLKVPVAWTETETGSQGQRQEAQIRCDLRGRLNICCIVLAGAQDQCLGRGVRGEDV